MKFFNDKVASITGRRHRAYPGFAGSRRDGAKPGAAIIPTRLLCVVAATLVALLSGCNSSAGLGADNAVPTAAASVPFAPTPDADPFYAQPKSMPQVAPGTILNSRPVSYAPAGVALPNKAWQLQFLSHDAHGRPIAAIATVIKPLIPRTGGPVLLSQQYAEDSLGSQCAPSHTLTGSIVNVLGDAELAKTASASLLGWTLVIPDHEGPYSAFAVGRLAGQITLDGIRAALAFAPLGLAADTPVGLWGYSGGGIATAWAASFQQTYAPELNIVGAAVGAPATNLIEVARNANTNLLTNALYFSLVFGAVQGINRAFPQLLTPYLNDKGKATLEAMKDGCVGGTSDGLPIGATGHFDDYTTVPGLLDAPSTQAVAPLINLPQPGHSPVADVFVYHAVTDELLLVEGTDAMVDAWCADGTPVHYYRPAVGEHVATDVLTAPFVVLYLTSRFAGTAPLFLPGTTSCN